MSKSLDFVATLQATGYSSTLIHYSKQPHHHPSWRFGAARGFLAPLDVDDEQTGGTVEETLDEAVSLGEGELQPWPVSLRMRLRCRVVDGASGKSWVVTKR